LEKWDALAEASGIVLSCAWRKSKSNVASRSTVF